MKTNTASLVLSALFVSAAAMASPPPGHPATGPMAGMQSSQMKSPDAKMSKKGKVLTAIDAGQYTYIEVAQGKKTTWLAAPAVAVKKDNVIRFEEGAAMSNFHSKTLSRTFPSIMFINQVVVTNEKE